MVVVVLAAQVVDVGGGDQRPAELAGVARRCPRSPSPARRCRSSGPRSRPARRPKTWSRSSTWARASSGRSSTRRRQKRDCRQPVSAITPSEWRASSSMSTFALPREKPSRKPAELSLTRLRNPASVAASRVRWLRSYPALGVAIVDEVGLEADDRLDPVLAAGLVELDGAVHHPVVGEPERRHPELGGAGGHRVDLAGAVEQRVLAVDVQVDDAPAHVPIIAIVSVGIDPRER